MTKGISPLISTILVVLMTFTAIGLVMSIGRPAIDRAYDSARLNEALQNLRSIDNAVREVASEGINAFRPVQIKISGGSLYVNEAAGTIEYFNTIKKGLIEQASFTKDNNIFIIGGGNARAYNNTTNMFLENGVLNVTLPLIGTSTNFAAINTSSAISSIQLIKSGKTLLPADTSIIIQNISNTSWGIGYSKLVKMQERLPTAQALFHVQSNLSSAVYDVVYSLPASADFIIVDIKNVTNNMTTMNLITKLGATKDDYVNISNGTEGNVATFPAVCRNASSVTRSFICAFDNGTDFSSIHFTGLIFAGDNTNYVQACFSDYSTANYKMNISFNNDGRVILPFASGTCGSLDARMNVINKQRVPSRSFNDSYALGESGDLQFGLILEYDRIKIQGSDHFGPGLQNVCIQKTGEIRYRSVVNVSKC
jgi:flagellin-like protein